MRKHFAAFARQGEGASVGAGHEAAETDHDTSTLTQNAVPHVPQPEGDLGNTVWRPQSPEPQGLLENVPLVPPVPQRNGMDGSSFEHFIDFEERAAVLEYDEGLPRSEAERLAAEQVGLPATKNCSVPKGASRNPTRPAGAHADARTNGSASRRHFTTYVAVTGPGVTVGSPAVALPPREYDAVLDRLIAAAGDKHVVSRLQRDKLKGRVVDDGLGRKVYTMGRL